MSRATEEIKPLPGTQPDGIRDEVEAARRVREMFTRIAPRYDLLNRVISFRTDVIWRRRVASRFREILERPDARVLDLCCGTGDLAFALERVARRGRGVAGGAQIYGADFAHPMLLRAREKAAAMGSGAAFVEADAMGLPLADASVDLVTSAFGFRNLANYSRGLQEIHRVLRPGGEVGILEFPDSRGVALGGLYRFYFRRILPAIGGAISGSREAYQYLPASVDRFPSAEKMTAMMEECGFQDVSIERWTFGVVSLFRARKR
jgi:demethylmenaquinone methyltransferase / 2-methoxy-6-polyprenyl-1,4-benzoquinol methylase